ncbi:phage/plasmid primase, P4 family [Blautia obeum]|uniref:phage/plasmid primase, P4 family n=1 Tax=Blautia obeum TaxID=40520 RepID=UPI0015F65BA9|nr:phage/plasmid primase, P4 family [Blautia obeum]
MAAEAKNMKEWALHYAEMGLAVFPLACRDKVPAVVDGCKAATTERTTIERWWDKNPQYNIGIATGNKSSGLVVIDLDVDKNKGIDGYDVLRDWQNKHGKLPETWQSITGRGGYHYFYKDAIVHSNRVGLYEGVDIRGEGGYIVAPPSVHPNGNIYEWEQGPEEYEIAQVDNIVNDFLKGEKQRRDSEHKTNFKVPELIPEGKRVDTIVRLIASLRTKGLDDDAIKAAVRVENEKRCNPPLKEKELEKAVFPALKRDWQVNSPYYNNFNAMNENDNKYVNEVLKKLNELNAVERFPMNDRGSADLFATVFMDVSRYNPTKKDWMYYDGTRWVADQEGMRAKRNAKTLADVLVRYSATVFLPDDKRQSYIKYAAGMMNYRSRNVMVTDAKDLNFFENMELDKDDFLLNCKNCVLDLSGDQPKALEHSADLLLSKLCNANYNPAATCTLWDKTVNEIMQGDTEKIKYLQKMSGRFLTGDTSEEEFYIFFGATTRNGKSTITELLLYLLGDYATTISPESLAIKANKDSRTASPDIAKLAGTRFVVASEPPRRMLFDSSLVKTLTGRDTVSARFLHENEFQFKPKFKLILNSNYLPVINDKTVFSSNRVKVIPFERHFAEKEQNKHLKEQLQQEIDGILNWCIEGLYMYRKEGLEPPEAVRTATHEYSEDSDKTGKFISECLVRSEHNLAAKDVYEKYSQWCNDCGLGIDGRTSFYEELKTKNLLSKTGTVAGKTVKNVIKGYSFVDEIFHPVDGNSKVPFP